MDTVTEAPKSHCCHNTHMQIVTLASYILILERERDSKPYNFEDDLYGTVAVFSC